MKIYGLKNCDTCRKAAKALPGAELWDLRAQGIPDGLIERAFADFGTDLLNKRSATWRGLDENQRALPVPDLIAANPAVMKRPLIDDGARLYLGWSDETRAALA